MLSALGQSINIMTLGGLALAVGVLVDDATVEIENMQRNLALGKDLRRGDPRWRPGDRGPCLRLDGLYQHRLRAHVLPHRRGAVISSCRLRRLLSSRCSPPTSSRERSFPRMVMFLLPKEVERAPSSACLASQLGWFARLHKRLRASLSNACRADTPVLLQPVPRTSQGLHRSAFLIFCLAQPAA